MKALTPARAFAGALGARASRPHANAVRLRSLLARLGLRSPDGQGPAAANAAMLKANAREALTSLRLNPQRTALAALGIVLGVASVTAMVSVGVAARAEARERFKELGTETLVVRKAGRRAAEGIVERATIEPEDVALLPGRSARIAAAAPALQVFGTVTFAGRRLATNRMLGVTGAFRGLAKLSVQSGRFLSDLDGNRPFCVAGSQVAEEMRAAGRAELVGEVVSLAGRLCTIVGVLDASPESALTPFWADEAVLVPLGMAQRVFGGAEIQAVMARMAPSADPDAAAAELKRYFRDRGVTVRVAGAEQLVDALQQQMRLFTLLLAAVGGISLVVGGASAMNVMLASVTERRREVGIRRALGARRAEIRNQFLTEAVALALAGGLLGIAIGIAVPFGICLYAGWTFTASPAAMALGFAVAAGVGIFFGAYPASRAAALDPIAALRAE